MQAYIVRFVGAIWVALFIAGASAHAQSDSHSRPEELVKQTVAQVLSLAAADSKASAGDISDLANLVEAKIVPHFDFATMTRLAVGKHWREANESQRQRLTQAFKTLLVRTYTRAYALHRDVKATVLPSRTPDSAKEATVRTQLALPGNAPPVTVDYDMRLAPEGWKVYNVTVDGVSLVTTYRAEFTEQIRTGGVDGLIKRMEERKP